MCHHSMQASLLTLPTPCSVEYNISYLYHSLHSFFARDNVALPGFAKYFDDASTEEREHARKLMYVQSVRGGRVKLLSIGMPEMEVRPATVARECGLSAECCAPRSQLPVGLLARNPCIGSLSLSLSRA